MDAVPGAAAPAHEVITIPDFGAPGRDALRQQCFDVRIAVFVREQGFPLEAEIDAEDDTATHFLLRLVPSLAPIGTVRCVKPRRTDALPAYSSHHHHYKLGRLAVLGPYRKHRLGRALVLALHAWAQHDAASTSTSTSTSAGSADSPGARRHAGHAPGHITLTAHSQLPVKAFYAKFGYEPEGEEFQEDGAPHQKMVLRIRLPNTYYARTEARDS